MEIISGIRDNGFLILNADDKMLKTVIENFDKYTSNLGKNITLITYGIENKNADFVGEIVEKTETSTKIKVKIQDIELEFEINTVGIHNVYNSLVAIVISKIFDIKLENVKKALVNMKVTEHRMDKFVIGKNITIYDDTYNASYESVKAAIDVISNIKQEEAGRKIYILGDILELGEFSERYHKKIADYLTAKGYDIVITAGENAETIMEELNKDIIEQNMEEERKVFHYADYNEVIQHLDILKENDIVLVKASNGMKFSNIIKYLKEKDQEEIEKELEQALEQDTNLSTQLNEVQI